jgi:hypothetical protein
MSLIQKMLDCKITTFFIQLTITIQYKLLKVLYFLVIIIFRKFNADSPAQKKFTYDIFQFAQLLNIKHII